MEQTYYTKNDIIPGAKLPINLYVMLTDYGTLHFSVHKPETKNGHILIEEMSILVQVPSDFNVTSELVKCIDGQMEQEREKMHTALARLQLRKDELLKISYAGNDILDAE